MPVVKKLDERMTVNIESWKKTKIQEITKSEGRSDSDFLLEAVNTHLEAKYGISNAGPN